MEELTYTHTHAHAHTHTFSVTCVSTSPAHINPTLAINNGAVNINSNDLTRNWPTSITLATDRGLYTSGLLGLFTCKTERDTYNSSHIIHTGKLM